MPDQLKPTVIRIGPDSFESMIELSRLADDVLRFIQINTVSGRQNTPEALQIRLLWQILLALDNHAAGIAAEAIAILREEFRHEPNPAAD